MGDKPYSFFIMLFVYSWFSRKHFVFSCGRASPIWHVSHAACSAPVAPRIGDLAQHKTVHRDYQPRRSVETIIPRPALLTSASGRLESLAAAKNRDEGPYREPQWMVSQLSGFTFGSLVVIITIQNTVS